MRLTRTTYIGLFCCLAFVIYLRLTRRRRRRNIARLEALLGRNAVANPFAAIDSSAGSKWTNALYEMQGVVQQVFPAATTGNTVQMIYSSYPARGCCISDEDFDRLYERPIRKAESLPEFGGSA